MSVTSPATIRLFARRCDGSAISDDYVDWAIAVLSEGCYSDSLAVLAGLRPPFDRHELDRYFEGALEELGWQVPACEQVWRQFARLIAQDIVTGTIEPYAGSQEMCWISSALDYPKGMSEWLRLSDVDELRFMADPKAQIVAQARAMLARSPEHQDGEG